MPPPIRPVRTSVTTTFSNSNSWALIAECFRDSLSEAMNAECRLRIDDSQPGIAFILSTQSTPGGLAVAGQAHRLPLRLGEPSHPPSRSYGVAGRDGL